MKLNLPRVASVIAVCAGTILGCRTPGEVGDARACQQTYEFGNTGCFEVTGQVVDSLGQPLRGISVVARSLATAATVFNAPASQTDVDGRFRIRSSRMVGNPPVNGSPDTLSTYVIASDRASAGIGIPATIRDSVLTTVTIAPVGAIPDPAVVRITLQKP